jgi:2-iminobutanoate/2-iminopropanoate deaminase
MNHELIAVHPSNSAAPKGPYTPAIRSGDFLFVSGQIGLDPATGKLVPGGTQHELKQALNNLHTLLQAVGATPAAVVKTTLFLVDMGEFAAANEVYARFFDAAPKPARSCVAVVALPAGARVEIEAVARL